MKRLDDAAVLAIANLPQEEQGVLGEELVEGMRIGHHTGVTRADGRDAQAASLEGR